MLLFLWNKYARQRTIKRHNFRVTLSWFSVILQACYQRRQSSECLLREMFETVDHMSLRKWRVLNISTSLKTFSGHQLQSNCWNSIDSSAVHWTEQMWNKGQESNCIRGGRSLIFWVRIRSSSTNKENIKSDSALAQHSKFYSNMCAYCLTALLNVTATCITSFCEKRTLCLIETTNSK